jgi:hypothetical protein
MKTSAAHEGPGKAERRGSRVFTYLPVSRGVANLPAAVVAGAGVGGGLALLSRGRGGGGEGSEAGSDNGEDLHVGNVLLKSWGGRRGKERIRR